MKLDHFKLGPRLGLGFGVVLMLAAGIAGIGWNRLGATQGDIAATSEMDHRAAAAERWMRLTELNIARALALAKSGYAADVQAYFSPQIKATSAEITGVQSGLAASIASDEGRQLLTLIDARRTAYLAERKHVVQLLEAGDADASAAVDSRMLPAAEKYLDALRALRTHEAGLSEARTAEAQAAVDAAQLTLLGLAGACIAVGAVLAWAISRSVTVPLRRAVQVTATVAGGDLSQPIHADGRDEVADVLRGLSQMQAALREVVSKVRSSTDSITTASSEIATGNSDLSARTEQAASNLQQTAASMEQITGTVRQSAESARAADGLAHSAAEVAGQGGRMEIGRAHV